MRYLIGLFFSIIISTSGFSQDYMKIIATKSCDCLDIMSDTLDVEESNMELGLCMIDASIPYKKQLKKDHDINFDKIAEHGERLGTIIGLEMASICPTKLLKLSKSREKGEAEYEYSNQIIQGEVVKIEDDLFVTIHLKDDFGKTAKYYWFTFIQSDYNLPLDYKSLIGKNIVITYNPQEFFDPRIVEYRRYNIISRID
ncbi:MAG: hypothetical protein H6589_05830 [Flavobacteriales bacterium]|nr:hypothetical protein [Flavobacteriales bacterium]